MTNEESIIQESWKSSFQAEGIANVKDMQQEQAQHA